MRLSIIIPVYNEEATIGQLLQKVVRVRLPQKIEKEIIVVDDGSKDSSKLKVKSSKFAKSIKLIENHKNLGKGAAVRRGIKYSNGDLIIIQDADLEYNPKDYLKLLKSILSGNAEVVYGSRLKNYPLRLWGKNKTVLPTHLIGNRFLTWLTNILFGSTLTDMETCFKLFKRSALLGINLRSDRFDFEPEITVKFLKKGLKIYEVPISVKPRTYQEGKKINWKDGLAAMFTLFKYKFQDD